MLRATVRHTLLALGLLLAPCFGTAHVDAGELVENGEYPTLSGGRHALLAKDRLNVLVFFRPGQERSLDTLQRMAECEVALAQKPVHMVGVVSGSDPLIEVKALVAETGVKSPVLIDQGDQLYGRLELRQHPMIVIVDRKNRIAAFEPYVRLRYCEIVRARIAFLLGEIKQADLDRVVKPPKAEFPNEVGGGAAVRFVRLGNKELQKGNCALAVRAFDKALERDPRNAEALAGKARCEGGTLQPAQPAPEKRPVKPVPLPPPPALPAGKAPAVPAAAPGGAGNAPASP